MAASNETPLDKQKHAKYWQRCYNAYLPSPYTSSESTRLMWASFIISAHDLLSIPFNPAEHSRIRTWILGLQHPDGGFCGSPTHYPPEGHDGSKGHANLAATFFALIALAIAADGEDEVRNAFAGVNRTKLLGWLRKLQREDGSFGQHIWDGEPVGGADTRHSYLACSVRWMLRGDVKEGDKAWVDDIDVEATIAHIRLGQTYDGGLAEFSRFESHAGYVYCAVAALHMLDRPLHSGEELSTKAVENGIPDRQRLLRFLAGRQFAYLEHEEEQDDNAVEGDQENYIQAKMDSLNMEEGCRHVGFNGRWNKKADTCYCWWVAGTLAMLGDGALNFVSAPPSRRYLLEITQHTIGGFGKIAGAPPDIYHSYLGLAALATMGDGDLKEFDVGLCCTKETAGKIEKARDGLVDAVREKAGDSWDNDGFWGSAN